MNSDIDNFFCLSIFALLVAVLLYFVDIMFFFPLQDTTSDKHGFIEENKTLKHLML